MQEVSDNWGEMVAAIVGDVISSIGGPGNTASATIIQLIKRRAEAAAKIALEEFQQGRSLYPPDDTAAMLFRYLRAAQEGAARINLRLMAKIMAGQNQEKPLVADDFLFWAEMIASLRREEIILLSTLLRHWYDWSSEQDQFKRMSNASQDCQKALVPSIFAEKIELMATMAALTRTGLLVPESSFGSIVYQISPLLERLDDMASLEATLQQES